MEVYKIRVVKGIICICRIGGLGCERLWAVSPVFVPAKRITFKKRLKGMHRGTRDSPSHSFLNDCLQLRFAEQYLDEALTVLSTILWCCVSSHSSLCQATRNVDNVCVKDHEL